MPCILHHYLKVVHSIYQQKKSELLDCFDTGRIPDPPERIDARIVDGATVVHCLPTSQVRTF